ncbi:unnamed protein product, partial [Rhizoctonia solani]
SSTRAERVATRGECTGSSFKRTFGSVNPPPNNIRSDYSLVPDLVASTDTPISRSSSLGWSNLSAPFILKYLDITRPGGLLLSTSCLMFISQGASVSSSSAGGPCASCEPPGAISAEMLLGKEQMKKGRSVQRESREFKPLARG